MKASAARRIGTPPARSGTESRRRAPFTALAALTSLTGAFGCSAMGLGDFDLRCEPAPLHGERETYQDPCAALNEEHGLDLSKDCFVYQCRPDGHGCEKRAQDLDGDGAPDAKTCGEAGLAQALDCDDGDARRAPDQRESCNGVDDDCDGLVDEGVSFRAMDIFAEPVGWPVERLSQAGDPARWVLTITQQAGSNAQEREFEIRALLFEAGKVHSKGLLAPSHAPGLRIAHASAGLSAATLLAAGVNTRGCAAGELRLSAVDLQTWGKMGAEAVRWLPATEGEECGGAAPPLLVAAGRRAADHQGLVLFRTGSTLWGQPFALRNAGTSAPALAPSAPEMLDPLDARAPASLLSRREDGELAGYLAAYPGTPEGPCRGDLTLLMIEPARVGQPLSVRRSCLPYAQVQQLALAVPSADLGALATRVAVALSTGSKLIFVELALDPDTQSFVPPSEPLTWQAEGTVTGLTLSHASIGPDMAAKDPATGDYFVLWTEAGPTHRLRGVRVSEAAQTLLGAPFTLMQGEVLRHLTALPVDAATPHPQAAYALVSGPRDATLHIGAAVCETPE